MKKIKILLSAALMTMTSIGIAQEVSTDGRDKIHFGIKAGTNYSNVYDEKSDEFNADAKFGFVGGAFFSIPIGRFLGVQPEILFSQKGFKGQGNLLGSNYEFTRTTSYIDVPLQFALKPTEFLTIVAGPQYSYLLKRTDEFTSSSSSFSQEEEFKNDDIRKNIFGFVWGVDVYVKKVVLGARMGWDIQNNNGNGTSSTPRYKNAWVQGTIGYSF